MSSSVFPVPLSGIQESILDAKGDLIVATAADNPARLAVGSANQVLTVDSSTATGLKWATPVEGSMTQISTGSFAGSTTSITSIPSTYNHLVLWATDYYGTGANIINVQFNSNTSSVYSQQKVFSGASPTVAGAQGTDISTGNGAITSSNSNSWLYMELPFYSTTVSDKFWQFHWARTGNTDAIEYLWGTFNSTSAISSIQFFLDGGSTWGGGTWTLYGVK